MVPVGWLVRLSLATVVMAGVVAALWGFSLPQAAWHCPRRRVVFIATAGAAIFIVVARALGISEFNGLTARYRSLAR